MSIVEIYNGINTTKFRGRVIKVEQTVENRNWSDTLDYSDWRPTKCTWALIWLGKHGPEPVRYYDRDITLFNIDNLTKTRNLLPREQFAWIDCTSMFGGLLVPTVDSSGDQLLNCGPAMWDAYITWQLHQKNEQSIRETKIANDKAQRANIEQDVLNRKVKNELKQAALKAAAEKSLDKIPAKGTTVTIDNFTGKIFWIGVSKYRGKWNARAGIKNTKGDIVWVPVDKF